MVISIYESKLHKTIESVMHEAKATKKKTRQDKTQPPSEPLATITKICHTQFQIKVARVNSKKKNERRKRVKAEKERTNKA